MRIVIADGKHTTIRGKTALEGDSAIVNKELGERLIEEGIANRVIEEPENRMKALRFSGHTKIFQGSDGKRYVMKGKDYVEVKE